jgi:hypothetical protein
MTIYAGLDEHTALSILEDGPHDGWTIDDAVASLERIGTYERERRFCRCESPERSVGSACCVECGKPVEQRWEHDRLMPF